MGLFHPKSSITLSASAVGDRAETTIIARLVGAGYNVLKPVHAALRYDLVIEDADGQFWRIQCKTGRYKKGTVEFNTMRFSGSAKGRSYAGGADYFAVYYAALDKIYLVPVSAVPVGHGVLRLEPAKTNNAATRLWAKDYEL